MYPPDYSVTQLSDVGKREVSNSNPHGADLNKLLEISRPKFPNPDSKNIPVITSAAPAPPRGRKSPNRVG